MRPLAALVLVSAGCAPEGDPVPAGAPPAPPGAVLLVEDLPIRAEEVEPLVRDIRQLYPEYTLLHARRLALTNEILPRAAVHARHREAREAALVACRDAEARLDEESPWSSEGNWAALGIGLWSAARALHPQRWSEPIELIGRWVRLRLDERREGTDPQQEVLRISVLEFPYVDYRAAPEAVELALDTSSLTLVDPAWGEAVPETWKHRMRGP